MENSDKIKAEVIIETNNDSLLYLVIRRLKVCFWKYRKQQTDIFNWNRENGYW